MLICLVVIFFVSWSPIILNNLLVSFEVLPNLNWGPLWYLRLTFYALSYINSCSNPIVYALMSMKFREAYRNLFNKMFGNIDTNNTTMISTLNDPLQQRIPLQRYASGDRYTRSMLQRDTQAVANEVE